MGREPFVDFIHVGVDIGEELTVLIRKVVQGDDVFVGTHSLESAFFRLYNDFYAALAGLAKAPPGLHLLGHPHNR